ncbi:MAG: hypothetical protein ABI267_10970 [Ginsengibacter sp.]
MKQSTIVKASFFISYLFIILGAYMQLHHFQNAGTFLMIGIASIFIFISSAIREIRTSVRIDNSEKTRWTSGLILFSPLAGLIYILFARRRIVNS